MTEISIYDFDKTIYDGNSSHDFYIYCMKKYPKAWRSIWWQLWGFIKYTFNLIKLTEFKSHIFSYVKYIDNIDSVAENFWSNHKHKIKDWYLIKDHSNDVIISASPEFILEKICYDHLKVKLLIGTKADKLTGKISGNNCYGNQKVCRLNEKMKEYKIVEFYSDCLSDEPLALLAEKKYIVVDNDFVDWIQYSSNNKRKKQSHYLFKEE